MLVANPIYDIVFKYLMEDERIAKTILSALLKKDVVDVKVRRNEYSNSNRDNLSIFRIDFGATIQGIDGNKKEVGVAMKKIRFLSESPLFNIIVVENGCFVTNSIYIDGLSREKILYDRYYKTLNLFSQMYQNDEDKRLLNHLETIYVQDEDLYFILLTLEKLKNDINVMSEMTEEDKRPLLLNRKHLIELWDSSLEKQDTMFRGAVRMLLNEGKDNEQIASTLGVSVDVVRDCG